MFIFWWECCVNETFWWYELYAWRREHAAVASQSSVWQSSSSVFVCNLFNISEDYYVTSPEKTPYPMPNVHVFSPKTSPKNQASRFPPQKNQASSCRKGWNIRASGPTFGASMASPGCFSSWPPLQSCAWDALSAWRPRIWRCSCGPRRDEAGSCEMRWLIVDFMFFFENHEVFTVDLCRFMLIYVYLDFPFHPLWCRLLDVISFLSMFCSVHVRFGLRKQEVQLHVGAI